MTLSGWPADTTGMEEELRPFARHKYELSVEEGCVLWGNRVVVPSKGRSQILQMLHEAHPGIAHMKSLARGYVWWPGIDQELQHCVKSCQRCQINQKSPCMSKGAMLCLVSTLVFQVTLVVPAQHSIYRVDCPQILQTLRQSIPV